MGFLVDIPRILLRYYWGFEGGMDKGYRAQKTDLEL